MSRHSAPHPLAGQKVDLTLAGRRSDVAPQGQYRVEDWWDRIAGQSWGDCQGNPACLTYAMRAAFAGLPTDDEVVYGKDERGLGHLVHVSELQNPGAVVPTGDPDLVLVATGQLWRTSDGDTVHVRRTARDGTWADILVTQPGGASWTKRQPLTGGRFAMAQPVELVIA